MVRGRLLQAEMSPHSSRLKTSSGIFSVMQGRVDTFNVSLWLELSDAIIQLVASSSRSRVTGFPPSPGGKASPSVTPLTIRIQCSSPCGSISTASRPLSNGTKTSGLVVEHRLILSLSRSDLQIENCRLESAIAPRVSASASLPSMLMLSLGLRQIFSSNVWSLKSPNSVILAPTPPMGRYVCQFGPLSVHSLTGFRVTRMRGPGASAICNCVWKKFPTPSNSRVERSISISGARRLI